ncbi:bone marrow proteoglycan-like isoform X2 [Calypte anna]|uniref:bone marrow proteoglycan-like isoform X2 n=1 Tax=Calypte anna TaxID=9244 RepID=UPI0011C3D671|nr:bone marrow proteoglycan-like isoform X2 [Calypte anna]
MCPCLLLVLSLLGTSLSSPPGLTPSSPAAPPGLTLALEHPQFRYAVVTKLRTYAGALEHCQRVFGGLLASVHSISRNKELVALARTYTHRKVWIGAVTSYRWGSWWEDASPWNYANWATAQPSHLIPTCTTLSTHDGLWRSRFCFELHPFICQY